MNIDLFIKYCKVMSDCAHHKLIHKMDDNLRIEYINDTIKLLKNNCVLTPLGTDNDTFIISVFVEADEDGYYKNPCNYIFDEGQIKISCGKNEIYSIESKEDLFNLSIQYDNLTFSYEELLKIQEENKKHDFKIEMYFTVGEEKYAANQ